MSRWISVVALFAVSANLTAAGPKQEQLVERVKDSISSGIRYLKKEAGGRGHWETDLISGAKPGGTTSLALLAMLNCGVKPDDQYVQRGLEYLRRRIEPQFVYVVGLQTMVFAEAGDPQDLPRIQRNVDWLIRARVMDGTTLKGWGYDINARMTDFSNSQYALLGLYAGRHAGAKVDDQVWESIENYYSRTQEPDGGWVYSYDYGNRGPTLTMTIAGICSMSIAGQELNANRRKLNDDGSDPECGKYPKMESIQRALKWINEGDGFGSNRFRFTDDRGHTFYNIYGIERAGRLTGQRLIAGHDWYRKGCEYLVGCQHEDGSWFMSGKGADSYVNVSTSFALLFLSKGRTPILISKFAHDPGEDWNNKHHDTRHLVEFASKELFKKQPLAWQIYDARRFNIASRDALREEVGNLLQSPIVYMNGHQAPKLSAIQKQLLRQYLDEGGFLLAEACCGNPKFTDGFRTLMKELFPDSELAPLRADHPIFSAHFAMPKEFIESLKLEGIEQGCKTIVVFSPKPLAGYWELNKYTPRAAKMDVPAGDRGTCAFRLAGNVIAYATGLEMPKPRLTEFKPPDDHEDRHVPRGFLKVGQLQHEGDWQPAPRAMSNLMRFVREEYKLDVTIQKEDMPVNTPDIYLFKFLYMHGRKSFDIPSDQLDNLRANLKTGGVLLADACCGKTEFDKSFRVFAKRLFPDANLEPIPPDDVLFSSEINGAPITTVRLRRERPDGNGAEAEFRDTRPTFLEGIKINGRWAVIYSRYDLGCALEKHASSDCKGYDHESALRLAAAAALYSLKK